MLTSDPIRFQHRFWVERAREELCPNADVSKTSRQAEYSHRQQKQNNEPVEKEKHGRIFAIQKNRVLL